MRFWILGAMLLLRLVLPAAWAQTKPDPAPGTAATPGQQDMMATVQRAAHNQLGVLQYCQAQGAVGDDVVALQRRLLGMLPPAQVDGLDEAEAAGKAGTVEFAGSKVALADAARSQNSTPDAMCKRMADMLKAQAAQLPK